MELEGVGALDGSSETAHNFLNRRGLALGFFEGAADRDVGAEVIGRLHDRNRRRAVRGLERERQARGVVDRPHGSPGDGARDEREEETMVAAHESEDAN